MLDNFRPGELRSRKDRQFRNLILLNGMCVVFLLFCGGVFVFIYSAPTEARVAETAVLVEKEPAIRMLDVLVPVRTIDAGEQLHAALFKLEARPEMSVGERTIRGYTEIQDSYARSIISTGEPLSRDIITQVKPTSLITTNIPDGYRAVTITVDIKSGVEGWARPGARVDVAWTSTLLGKPGLSIIVQNALVLSAERELNPNPTQGAPVPSTISLLVTAKDSAKIQFASTTGQLTLSLRGDKDNGKSTGFTGIGLYDLIGQNGADDGNGEHVEGFAKFTTLDGRHSEMVIVNGQVIRKSGNRD